MTATPTGRRPGLFALVAVLHGVLAVAIAVGVVVFFRVIFLGDRDQGVFELVLLSFVFAFMVLVVVVFSAQTVNAITLLTRRGEVVGTYTLGRRFMEVLPLPTTRWSRFWIGVQQQPWRRWRLLLAAWLVSFAGLSSLLIVSILALVVAGALVIAEWVMRAPARA